LDVGLDPQNNGRAKVVTAPRIAVLLPTYRQPDILLLTLRDLSRQDYPRHLWELIILDDGGRDVSAMLALSVMDATVPMVVRRSPQGGNYSHAALFNELLRLATPTTEVFVHVEDVRLRPDFLAQHAKWHRDHSFNLVTGAMFEGPQETYEAAACSRWKLMRIAGAGAAAYECCFQSVFAKSMSYTTALRDRLTIPAGGGPFDVAMTGWGYHETEFAYRAVVGGATCIYDLDCGVYHPAHATRDEHEYRSIEREVLRRNGTEQNVRYLCRKHGIDGLPDWVVGVPIARGRIA